ncbi:MAG TPA: hypothetical protein ENK05_02200 [Gammaproteobacteria bacterium]|nr:hypothetical protein [Gammaproteobacteria bacterium]
MKSRWITNLLLLLGVAMLTLVARYQPGLDKPVETAAITRLSADQVRRIHLNRPVRPDLVLVRDAQGGWFIEHEPRLPADRHQVDSLTRLVQQKPVRSYAAGELELDRLQLDPPYASAIMNDLAIEFGGLEPLQDLRYVRVNDRVHLIPDLYLHLVEAAYTNFVRRRLLPPQSRIERLVLPGLTLSKDDGHWSLDPEQPVSADTLQDFVERWQDATALSVRAADADIGGTPIEIGYQGGKVLRLLLVAREPELLLARPDWGIEYRMGEDADFLLKLPHPEAAGGDAQPASE